MMDKDELYRMLRSGDEDERLEWLLTHRREKPREEVAEPKSYLPLPDIDTVLTEHFPMDRLKREHVTRARNFVQSLNLSEDNLVASVGSGPPDNVFWPKISDEGNSPKKRQRGPTTHDVWDRSFFDSGAQLHIFDPSEKAINSWFAVRRSITPELSKQITVNYGTESYFQNSKLPDDSVDVVVMMNLFGTPALLLDENGESHKIILKAGRVLKPHGLLIIGDQWSVDKERTKEMLAYLEQSGIKLTVIAKDDSQAGTPWNAYRIEK